MKKLVKNKGNKRKYWSKSYGQKRRNNKKKKTFKLTTNLPKQRCQRWVGQRWVVSRTRKENEVLGILSQLKVEFKKRCPFQKQNYRKKPLNTTSNRQRENRKKKRKNISHHRNFSIKFILSQRSSEARIYFFHRKPCLTKTTKEKAPSLFWFGYKKTSSLCSFGVTDNFISCTCRLMEPVLFLFFCAFLKSKQAFFRAVSWKKATFLVEVKKAAQFLQTTWILLLSYSKTHNVFVQQKNKIICLLQPFCCQANGKKTCPVFTMFFRFSRKN